MKISSACDDIFHQKIEKPHIFDSLLSAQNLGVAIISIATGKILDQKGYFMLEIFFCTDLCSKWKFSRQLFI